ncbi:unnamed protein product [Mytilus coruscus]|uniref:Uncharacterized protein n=1 Tax=Mytilus coruscus TaxID=42192 RepID=A0A6J8DEK8_MYTCO|nr:unnamed protein product [Mytilus coruscus]
MTPSLENFVVLTWLRLIHTDLPKLVKQGYGTELRSRTLSSIKPKVSQALDSLVGELRNAEEANVMRAATSNFPLKSKFIHEENFFLIQNLSDFLEIQLPSDICSTDDTFAIELLLESHISSIHAGKDSNVWPSPNLIPSVAGRIRSNLTQEPHSLRRNEHFCQIRSTYIPYSKNDAVDSTKNNDKINHQRLTNYSESVKSDPDDLLSQEIKAKFRDTLNKYDDVFGPYFKGYNGADGPFQARVNMGPVQPPQRKGRVPQNSRNQQ